MTEGPVGKGSKFRHAREIDGRAFSEIVEIMEFGPPRRLKTAAVSDAVSCVRTFALTEKAGGTDIEVELKIEAQSFAAKTVAFLFNRLVRNLGRLMAQDLADLKRFAEGEVRKARKSPRPKVNGRALETAEAAPDSLTRSPPIAVDTFEEANAAIPSAEAKPDGQSETKAKQATPALRSSSRAKAPRARARRTGGAAAGSAQAAPASRD